MTVLVQDVHPISARGTGTYEFNYSYFSNSDIGVYVSPDDTWVWKVKLPDIYYAITRTGGGSTPGGYLKIPDLPAVDTYMRDELTLSDPSVDWSAAQYEYIAYPRELAYTQSKSQPNGYSSSQVETADDYIVLELQQVAAKVDMLWDSPLIGNTATSLTLGYIPQSGKTGSGYLIDSNISQQEGFVYVGDTLVSGGSFFAQTDAQVEGVLVVKGIIECQAGLYVEGDSDLHGSLIVYGDHTDVRGNLFARQSAQIELDLIVQFDTYVARDTFVGRDLYTSGIGYFGKLRVPHPEGGRSDLFRVNMGISDEYTLDFTGKSANFSSRVTILNSLTVGMKEQDDDLPGTYPMVGLYNYGISYFYDIAIFWKSAYIYDKLHVTAGGAEITGDVLVAGQVVAHHITAQGYVGCANLTTTGVANVGGNLFVSGESTFSLGATFRENVNVDGTLTIGNNIILDGLEFNVGDLSSTVADSYVMTVGTNPATGVWNLYFSPGGGGGGVVGDINVSYNYFAMGDNVGGLVNAPMAWNTDTNEIMTTEGLRTPSLRSTTVQVDDKLVFNTISYTTSELETTYVVGRVMSVFIDAGQRGLKWIDQPAVPSIAVTEKTLAMGDATGGLVDAPIVYNSELDELTTLSDIKAGALIGDDVQINENLILDTVPYSTTDLETSYLKDRVLSVTADELGNRSLAWVDQSTGGTTIDIAEKTIAMGDGLGSLVDSKLKQNDISMYIETDYSMAAKTLQLRNQINQNGKTTFSISNTQTTPWSVVFRDFPNIGNNQPLALYAQRLGQNTWEIFVDPADAATLYVADPAYDNGAASWAGHASLYVDQIIDSNSNMKMIGNRILGGQISGNVIVDCGSQLAYQDTVESNVLTIETNVAECHAVTYNTNITSIVLSPDLADGDSLTLLFKRDTTGGVITWPLTWIWANSVKPDSSQFVVGSANLFTLRRDGTSYQASRICGGGSVAEDPNIIRILGVHRDNAMVAFYDSSGSNLDTVQQGTITGSTISKMYIDAECVVDSSTSKVQNVVSDAGILDIFIDATTTSVFKFVHDEDITAINIIVDDTIIAIGLPWRFIIVRELGLSTQTALPVPGGVSTPGSVSTIELGTGMCMMNFVYLSPEEIEFRGSNKY